MKKIIKELGKWDQHFMKLAEHVSTWSKDPNANVGAVVVDSRRRPVGLGFNGFPYGVPDDEKKLNDGDLKNEMVVHAEVNAILTAGTSSKDGTIYVYGKPICSQCAGIIIQSGIKRVVAMSPESSSPDSKWGKKGKIAKNMFKEAKIEIDFYSEDNIDKEK